MRASPVKWTPEMLERAERLHLRGEKPQYIANVLGQGLTRTAVYKKLSRAGLYKRVKGVVVEAPQIAPPPPVLVPEPQPEPAPPPPVAVEPPPPPPPKPVGLTLLQLSPLSCRWIINDPRPGLNEEAIFCGDRKVDKAPYCRKHWDMAHNWVGKKAS
jgi:hypothetical protein